MGRHELMVVAGVVAVGALGVLAGCDTVKAPYRPVVDQVPIQNYPKVTVQGELAGFIAVSPPVVERPSDVMKVTVPIRLLSDPGFSSNIQYRFIFLNASGVPSRGPTMNWKFQNLPPRDQVFLSGNALDSDAVDWRCEIRLAR